MLSLNIPILYLPGRRNIEIEIAKEGRPRKRHYRVEVIRWEEDMLPDEKRVELIRDLLAA